MNRPALILGLFLFSIISAAQDTATGSSDYARRESACDTAIEKGDYENAEHLCREALKASESLPRGSKTEKLNALKNYAGTLHRQAKFREALSVYTKVFQYSVANFPIDRFVVGTAYFLLGRVNQGMASINGSYIRAAILNFGKAEKILTTGLETAKDDKERDRFRERLRDTLFLQRYIATWRLDKARFDAAQTKLDKLDKQKNQ